MTFDEAFDIAAKEAKTVTVDEPLSSYWSSGFGKLNGGRLRSRILNFAPTPSERIKAVEAAKGYIRGVWMMEGRLPFAVTVREVVRQECGFAPLTMLWVFTMLVSLLANLKKLLEPAGQETQGVN